MEMQGLLIGARENDIVHGPIWCCTSTYPHGGSGTSNMKLLMYRSTGVSEGVRDTRYSSVRKERYCIRNG